MYGSQWRLAVTALTVAGLLLVPAGAMAAVPDATASHEDGTEPAFIAEMETDGTVEVTVRYTFNLNDETRADAFAQLQDNETAQEAFLTTFENRLDLVAADTAAATGRDLTVGNASIAFRTADSTGIVELSVPVENLAAVDGDRLTLSEPFASNFQPERQFRVVLPDGYEVVSASPEPTTTDGELIYAPDASLDEFELVAEPSPPDDGDGGGTDSDGGDGDGTTAGGGGPGFGAVAALVALAGTLVALRVSNCS